MKVRLKTLVGRVKADVPRLDAIITLENVFFVRTGQFEYRQLEPLEASKLHLWLSEHKKFKAREFTLQQVDNIIKEEELIDG